MSRRVRVYKKIRKVKSAAMMQVITEMLSLPWWHRVKLAWRIVFRTK